MVVVVREVGKMALADFLNRAPPAPVDEMGMPAGRDVPMTTGGPVVSGIQEYLRILGQQGVQPTPQNVNRARAPDRGVAPRAPMNVLPQQGERGWSADTGNWDTGNTSAPPTSVPPPDPNASNPGAANSGLLESLAPLILGGAPLAAILGRQYLDSRGKPPGTPADVAPAPGADLLNTKGPGFAPEYARPPGSITDTAGFKPEYGNAPAAEAIRSAVAPAEAAPRPLLQTAGVDLQPAPAPARAPSGPGFDPEIPPSPAKEAIDKAVEEPATTRAKPSQRGAPGKTARAKLRARL
jgi:hypothetical protein